MFYYQKVKSAAKKVLAPGEELETVMLRTMKVIADVVGATLGPGGRPVLMEKYEFDSSVFLTKDGVTVFRGLGFTDPVAHALMECARDSAARTAAAAGDGTTTAAVIMASLVRLLHAFCKANPRISPQKAVRELERLFREVVEPCLKKVAVKPALEPPPEGEETEEERGKRNPMLRAVARMSANGDEALADAVMRCYDVCGDAGHVTITEHSGPSRYEVESVEGFPIPQGYEDSCGPFYPKFVNDDGRQLCALNKPVFVLHHGDLSDVQSVWSALKMISDGVVAKTYEHTDVVIVATGFSERVLALLATNMSDPESLNPFPLVIPRFPYANGQRQFLDDLAAITGATVLDPIERPLARASLEDFGPGVEKFEASRWKSLVYGNADPDALLARVADLQVLAANPASELDGHFVNERIGRLTGGIARLKVFGGSVAETREKKDRADDAVCAVRGAVKSGCLPGGGWGLLRAADWVSAEAAMEPLVAGVEFPAGEAAWCRALALHVLLPALEAPVRKMLENCGLDHEEASATIEIVRKAASAGVPETYDAAAGEFVDAYAAGVLDSYPAVVEAVRNGLSAASNMGTMGGVVIFYRDDELERKEAHEAEAYKRDVEEGNPADQRA